MSVLAALFRAILLAVVLVLAGMALWRNWPMAPPGVPGGAPSERALPIPRPPRPPLAGPIDRIVVQKSARRLTVFREGVALRSYPVALGFQPEGAKAVQGDGRTPEGLYRIDRRNAQSRFHLSLGIDYPRPADRARAAAAGQPPGGDIFLHGLPNDLPEGARLRPDWTEGCIALENAEIEELWRITPLGTEVEILP